MKDTYTISKESETINMDPPKEPLTRQQIAKDLIEKPYLAEFIQEVQASGLSAEQITKLAKLFNARKLEQHLGA